MCSSMAHRLKSDVGNKIDVLPLDNPSMHEWRHSVFADPPWTPTASPTQAGVAGNLVLRVARRGAQQRRPRRCTALANNVLPAAGGALRCLAGRSRPVLLTAPSL